MASTGPNSDAKIYALVDYEDDYVQPLILSALKKRLPPSSYQLISSLNQLPSPTSRLLQFVQYESIDFDHLMEHSSSSTANAYIIRKALIRKHYLSTTIANWITKYPDSVLKRHVKPSVEFEVDYAEFLDDALVEAWELKESWERTGAAEDGSGREWWILKPGMSERGQGIRLFSTEEDLTSIFEEWDPESSDEEDGDEDEDDEDARSDASTPAPAPAPAPAKQNNIPVHKEEGKGIITSQLRHFIAQPYIHPPLLLTPPPLTPPPAPAPAPHDASPETLRKFHIRTYVVAVGALKIFVYKPMLALFAARPYVPPWQHEGLQSDVDEAMRAHLTNTCLQDGGEREGSVGLFWALPDVVPAQPAYTACTSTPAWKSQVFAQICAITGEVFEAAARGMSIHFQPLPNAFEIFGLDFMVGVEGDGELRTWLLEVNAFPDFRQTGGELKGLVGGLFEGVVERGVGGIFGVGGDEEEAEGMVKVLDIDLGRR